MNPAFQPVGPAPTVEVTRTMGPTPVEGVLTLTPPAGGAGWRFEVYLTGEDQPDHQGLVNVPLAFSYRFETPGTDTLRVALTGPLGREVLEWVIAVGDRSRARTVVRTALPSSGDDMLEGIAASRESVFVSAFSSGTLYRLDAQSLVLTGALTLDLDCCNPALTGLSVSPSDTLLFAIHSNDIIDVVSLNGWERISSVYGASGGHYILSVSDSFAYASGDFPGVSLVNVYSGEHRARFVWGRPFFHFDLSPRGDLFASAYWGNPKPVVYIADPLELTIQREIELPKYVNALAFDATGDRLFASVYREPDNGESSLHLVEIDPYSGSVVRDLQGGSGMGLQRCSGNPTARSASGRWIAFACDGATIIDATTGLPATVLSGTIRAVAADPDEDVFYFAHWDGFVEKVEMVK